MKTSTYNAILAAIPADDTAHTVDEIAETAGVSVGTARRYLLNMSEDEDLRYQFRLEFPERPLRVLRRSDAAEARRIARKRLAATLNERFGLVGEYNELEEYDLQMNYSGNLHLEIALPTLLAALGIPMPDELKNDQEE